MRAALTEVAGMVFRGWAGRFTLTASAVAQFLAWLAEDEPWWALVVRLALVPVYLCLFVGFLQFMLGASHALMHARRPTHSFLVLELKDGRRRGGQVCMAPCCLRKKIKYAMGHSGSVTLSLGDGSDAEVFGAVEVEDWRVMPVDNPDPHDTHGKVT